MLSSLILNIILPVAYFLLFAWLIIQKNLFHNSIFTQKEVLGIFALKTFWCVIYGIVYQRIGHSDTFDMFNASEQIYRSLFRDPRDFFQLVFLPNNVYFTSGVEHYIRSVDMYGAEGSYFLLRFHALVRFISFGSYYVHAVIFSFITLPGVVMLLNYFTRVNPSCKYFLVGILLIFPGIAFWCCGMHKEAVEIFSFGLIFQFVCKDKPGLKSFLLIITGIVLLAIVRPLSLAVFAPFVLASLFEKYFNIKPAIIYGISWGFIIVYTFISWQYHISPDVVAMVNERRNEFFRQYHDISINENSLLVHFINPLYNIFIKPLPHQGMPVSSWLYFFNNVVCFVAVGYLFAKSSLYNIRAHALMIFISSLLGLLIIGYIVSSDGALSRYKAPMLFLFMASFVMTRRKNQYIL